MTDLYYIPQNVLDSLSNDGLQELLFADDNPQFRTVSGLHYGKSNFHHRQCLLAVDLYELVL